MDPLPPDSFDADAALVARRLLGAVVESTVDGRLCRALVVETEAYVGPDDEASHAHSRFGVTPRNAVMYGPPGHAYLYRIYGIHWCLNAVTGRAGHPAAVLLRAARPLQGLEAMRRRRPGRPDHELLRGPGNLARALGLDGTLNRHRLDSPPLRLFAGDALPADRVGSGPRIGVTRATDAPLRFWLVGEPCVSRMPARRAAR